MKAYTPENLVAVSRYQRYFPTLPADIRQEVLERIAELIDEEKQYCDRGNYSHMAQILTSIALYEVWQKHGKSEEEAFAVVSQEMWDFLDPSAMQKLARKRFFLPLMKKIVPFGFKKAPAPDGATPGIGTIRRMNSTLSAMNAFTQRFSPRAAF